MQKSYIHDEATLALLCMASQHVGLTHNMQQRTAGVVQAIVPAFLSCQGNHFSDDLCKADAMAAGKPLMLAVHI